MAGGEEEVQFQFLEKRRELLMFLHQARGALNRRPKGMRVIQAEHDRHINFLVEQRQPALTRKGWPEARYRWHGVYGP